MVAPIRRPLSDVWAHVILTTKTVVAGGFHTVATYTRPIQSMVPFQGANAPQPTALQAHIYGVKNIYTVLIRFYAAYNLQNRELYILAMCSFAGVFFLYSSELLIWQTVRPRDAVIPLLTSSVGLTWMWTQMNYYVQSS